MKKKILRQKVIGVLASVMLLQGCTLELPPYKTQPIDSYKNIQVKDGLAVAIHPILDEEESEKYFGMNLLSSNILAVFVLSEHRHPSASFTLLKDNFSLSAGSRNVRQSKEDATTDEAAQAVSFTGALLFSPAIMLIGGKMVSDAHIIQHNFKAKEFQTKTLSPGQEAQGFIYFKLPEKSYYRKLWIEGMQEGGVPFGVRATHTSLVAARGKGDATHAQGNRKQVGREERRARRDAGRDCA